MVLWFALGLMTVVAVGLALAPLVRRAKWRRDGEIMTCAYTAPSLPSSRASESVACWANAKRRRPGSRWSGACWPPMRQIANRARGQRHAAGIGPSPWCCSWPAGARGGSVRPPRQPVQPGAPFAGRADERAEVAAREQETLPSVESMIAQLEAQLAGDPDDLNRSLRLGRAYALIGRFERSAETYRQAIQQHQGIAELHSALGEALVMASDGIVGPEARAAFDQALALDAADARARFYGGLAMLQRGERQSALDTWIGLIEDTPADAPWLPDLRQRTAALAEDLGLDPERALPASRAVAGGAEGARSPTVPRASRCAPPRQCPKKSVRR